MKNFTKLIKNYTLITTHVLHMATSGSTSRISFFPNIYWLDFHYYTNQETLIFASREDTTEYAMVEIYNGIRHRDIHICTHTHRDEFVL